MKHSQILLLIMAVAIAAPLVAGPPVDGEPDHASVTNYAIISATQTGASQVTVRVKAHYCTACNPNPTNAPGCTPFTHGYPGYPPAYSGTTHWCYPSNADGRYAAVQLRDSANSVIGTAKMVLNPTNWSLCTIHQRNIVVNTTTPMTPGATITVEADLYCSWCGHYYPAPITMTVAALASITVSPDPASILVCNTQVFTATGTDTLGNPIAVNPTWSVAPALGTFNPGTGPSTTFHGTTGGTGTVTASVGTVSGTAQVTVIRPNDPPDADAGPDQTVEQDSYAGASVTLDGSGSSDDGEIQPLTYTWTWAGGSTTGVNPTVTLPLGATTATLTVYDGEFSDTDTVDITVVDTTPPTITCPGDVIVEQQSHAGTVVPLQATATDICDPNPVITSDELPIYPLGVTVVTFTATDASGNSASCSMTVTVVDTTAPTINSISASPDVLWPPNHKMVDVTVTVEAEDICDPAPVCSIVNVTSNEPINGLGDGDKAPDWEITGDLTVKLRAERAGGGADRVYTIHVECTDASGNTATVMVEVTVPHDQRKPKK